MKRLLLILLVLSFFIGISIYFLCEQIIYTENICDNLDSLYYAVSNEINTITIYNSLENELNKFYNKFTIIFDNQKLIEIKISLEKIKVLLKSNDEKFALLAEIKSLQITLKQELYYTIPTIENIF